LQCIDVIWPVAPGEVVALFGSGLGPTQGVQTQGTAQSPLPVQSSGAQVTLDGTPVPLLWVQDSQINAVVPSSVTPLVSITDRTLQQRIDDDRTTFRKLLLEARQELAREYLNRPDMDVAEVAYLLGYEDSNSFYRAFRTWEGTTPSQLRAELKRPVN
jgi:transcriptional regulator GlxA family with amidase domain